MQYVLALDQGTTSSRAIVFDHAGSVKASAQEEFRQIFPQPGWVEHDAVDIWASQSGVLHTALARAGIRATDIAAIGITNQRETTVVWDRATGKPIANAIVWQDRRTAGFCDELRAAGHAATFAEKTGLVLDAYFSGTKLRWLLDHVEGARARAERGELCFGTIDSWLIFNLTGGAVHCTDASNASRTLLYNIHTGDWDDALLALLDVPRSVLPRIVASTGVCADALIDGVRVPIAGIAGDQQAALFGQACLTSGLAKNTYGTGCFLLLNTGDEAVASRNNLLTTVAWQRDRTLTYALEGSVFIGGAVVQWLRDGLHVVREARRDRSAGAKRSRYRRCFRRPGICRARGAALGPVRARRHLRAHPRHDFRAHRACSTRSRSPSRARTCSPPCRGTPASRCPSCASTAVPRPTTC